MITMNMFSVSDKKAKDILYVVLNSIKNAKEDDNVINYYLVIQNLDQQIIDYFIDLQSNTFHVYFKNASDYKDKIRPPVNSYLYYVRCLAPSIFPTLDKILYLDTDVFAVNSGIEQLWNTQLGSKYVAATTDIQIAWNDQSERINVGKNGDNNENYFCTGVMLMNLKQIREDGLDKQIEEDLMEWPGHEGLKCILYDQTLLNYRFGDHIKIVSSKWCNSILAVMQKDVPRYMSYYGTQDLLTKLNDAKLIHLKGPKCWLPQPAIVTWNQTYRNVAQQIFGQIYKDFGKHEEF